MDNNTFIDSAIKLIYDYVHAHLDKTDLRPLFDVFVVWNCYILGNQKALLSTTLHDDMYYEVTYDKNRDKIYLDVYTKVENVEVDPHSISLTENCLNNDPS